MEIELGDYIRTNIGEVGKVIAIKEEPERFVIDDCGQILLKADVVKNSKNIIDLIEEGDYVNGKKVYSLGVGIDYHNIPTVNYTDRTFDFEFNIKSIVTKEQMKSLEYVVKE